MRRVLVLMVLQSDFNSTRHPDLYTLLKNRGGVRWGNASGSPAAIMIKTHEPLETVHNLVEKCLNENDQVVVFELTGKHTGGAIWQPL